MRSRASLLASLSFALALLVAAAAHPAAVAKAYSWNGFYADFSGEELMRLTNYDRHLLGYKPLAVDQYLVGLAKNAPFRCPSSGTTVYGRSSDMAARSYFSHGIRGCAKTATSEYLSLDIMYLQGGYNTFRAENMAENNWSSQGWSTYQAGCDITGANCRGSSVTPTSVAVAERGFMRSQSHRNDILGNYDRFGCGAAANTATGMKYYTCLFSLGGSKPLDTAAPTFASVIGSGATVARGSALTIGVSFADAFRLSDGWLRIDGGPVVYSWA